MNRTTSPLPELPEPLAHHYTLAKGHYRAEQWERSLAGFEALLLAAEEQQHVLGRILGHRHAGACLYWMREYEASRDSLTLAMELARDAKDLHQELRVANHLGATLRKLGAIEDAERMFREALSKASLPEFTEERMRLLGNEGALMDELGHEAEASDRYARYEELCELTGDLRRLANARGLACRAAMWRGDFHGALSRAESEIKLGEQIGDTGRLADGLLHRGRVQLRAYEVSLATNGLDMGPAVATPAAARENMVNAIELAEQRGDDSRLVRFLNARANLECVHGPISAAWACVQRALGLAKPTEPETQARLHRTAALVCQAAGLHSDAMWYLERETRLRCQIYEGLVGARIKKLVERRQRELEETLALLCKEAGEVDRTQDEQARVADLIRRIQPSKRTLGDEELYRGLLVREESVPEWRARVRRTATQRWQARLIPGTYDRLLEDSRQDLILADVTYQGAVDDLARSVHLLLLVVERELRERVWLPAHRGKSDRDKARKTSIGAMLAALERHDRGEEQTNARRTRGLARVLDGEQEKLTAILRLAKEVEPLGGDPFALVDVRNAVAHGRDELRHLDRARVDAARRRIALEAPVVLEALVGFPVENGE